MMNKPDPIETRWKNLAQLAVTAPEVPLPEISFGFATRVSALGMLCVRPSRSLLWESCAWRGMCAAVALSFCSILSQWNNLSAASLDELIAEIALASEEGMESL